MRFLQNQGRLQRVPAAIRPGVRLAADWVKGLYAQPSNEEPPRPLSPDALFLLHRRLVHDEARLEMLVEACNNNGVFGAYHQLHLTSALTIHGAYDMRRYVDFYRLPDLTGRRVLDIGTSSGYFALECARRGGHVLAIDIWETTPVAEIARCSHIQVEYRKSDIYDLDESVVGSFDVVICGSLILHLPDPIGALRAIRRVCRGTLHISTGCPVDDRAANDRPLCEFVGAGTDVYWLIGTAALTRLLLSAGFARVSDVDHFTKSTEPGVSPSYRTPHTVMVAHAY